MFSLTGKKALVTGASGGIGQAIARALHQMGAHVVLSGRKEDALATLANELGERSAVLVSDLSLREEARVLVEKAEAIIGQVDILVCNAGITQDNLSLRMKEEEWERVIEINLTAGFLLNQAGIKKMIRRKWGRIINITSIVGVTGNAGQANYAASKAGLIGMTKSLAKECASRGITINCIAPGFIKTPMTDVLTAEQQDAIMRSIPRGQLGLPEDIAAASVYLASEEARYMTGQTLHINGGMLMV